MHPGMRREFFRRMLREMSGHGWEKHHDGWHHAGWYHECGERPSPEQRIAFLEEYQRDLEEQVADIATKIRRLREEMAATGSGEGDDA